MLPGDKVETAICVGWAGKLIKSQDEKLFVIEGVANAEDFKNQMREFLDFIGVDNVEEVRHMETINCVMDIDGNSLKYALMDYEEEFFNIAVRLPAIICSRVSPTQKA